jgi:LmbE family N-acetylglucosaminyl deacetylase
MIIEASAQMNLFRWIFLLLLAGCGDAVMEDASDDPPGADGNLHALLGTAPIHNLLWIGAHPDDEVTLAPLLAGLCHQPAVACHFLVLTDGGKGNCALGRGACGVPDRGGAGPGTIGALRIAEMANSAAFFGGDLRALVLEDTPAATVLGDMRRWNQTYSQVPNDTSIALVRQRVAQAIIDSKAEVIFTFDPRHGTYCHPDHRAAAALALLAAQQVGFDLRKFYMSEMASYYLDATGQPAQRPWVPSDPSLLIYDASEAGTWAAVPTAMGFHRSQYSPAAVSQAASLPAAIQKLAIAPVASALVAGKFPPSAYDAICASEAVWDGRGICLTSAGGLGPCW